MKRRALQTITLSALLASAGFAQNNQRQASIVGGGSPDRGKCTVEVVVDGVAQVEIRGTTASLRTLSGQPAQWRRFECTGAMPGNPANFRFSGVDGRGKQELTRDPRNGGVAVVQIEDKDSGSEGYTFDINWSSGGSNSNGYPDNRQRDGRSPNVPDRDQRGPGYPPPSQERDQPGNRDSDRDRTHSDDRYRPNYRDSDYYRKYGHGYSIEEAIRVCQQAVFTQAARRFGTEDVHFHRTTADDNPGREDRVNGSLDVHRGGREERFGFSCSMSFETGRLRSADLDMRPLPDNPRSR